MPKVTMLLTDQDAQNAEFVYKVTQARSRAHAISIALNLARFVLGAMLERNAELMLRVGRRFERIVIPEFQNLRHKALEQKPQDVHEGV